MSHVVRVPTPTYSMIYDLKGKTGASPVSAVEQAVSPESKVIFCSPSNEVHFQSSFMV